MNVISPLLQFQNQLRIFHWQTDSYSKHKAFGKTYENLDGLVDSFVETYMGIFGRSKPTTTFSILLKPLLNDQVVDNLLLDFKNYLNEMNSELSEFTDLLNIRDEILNEVNKLNYLLSLK